MNQYTVETQYIVYGNIGHINKVNWNILVTLGKQIKRDSTKNVNKGRKASK